MSETNKELVRRHFDELWNHRDLAVADELMAEDYLEHAVAPFGQDEPGRVNGPAAMRQTAQCSGSATASWPSTGRPARTSRRCCSWAWCSRRAGRRPR